MRYLTLFFSLVLGLATLGVNAESPAEKDTKASEASADTGTSEDTELQRWVQDLGNPEYGKRREAFFQLWGAGPEALPAVESATASADLQVARTAQILVPILKLDGIDPSSELYDLVVEPSRLKLLRLCEKGYWKLAEQVLLKNDSLREEISGYIATNFLNSIARLAMKQGEPLKAWPIVRVATNTLAKNYAGADLAVWLETRQGLEPGDSITSPDLDALRLLYSGNAREALELPVSNLLKERIYSRFGLWDELNKDEVRALYLQGGNDVPHRAAEAVLLEYGGNFRAADTIWEQLLAAPEDGADSEEEPEGEVDARFSRWQKEDLAAVGLIRNSNIIGRNQLLLALMASGRSNAVQEYFRETDKLAAFDFFAADNDFASAFELLGLQADLSNFEQWIVQQERLLVAQAARPGRTLGLPLFSQAAHCCSMLVGLGYTAEAERYLEIICETADTKDEVWQRAIAFWMGRDESRALALRVIEKSLRVLPSSTKNTILQSYFPELGISAPLLAANLPGFKTASPNPPPLLEALEHIHAWDNAYFEHYGTSIDEWLRLSVAELFRNSSGDPGRLVLQLKDLARIAKGSGLDELALELSMKKIELGRVTPDHWSVAAEILMERGDASEAAELLKFLRETTVGVYDQASMVKEIKALLLSGQFENALQLDHSRWMRPLAVTRFGQGAHYARLGAELFDEAEFDAAEEYSELAFQQAGFASMDLYWAAGDLARIYEEQEMFGESADALRAPLTEALRPRSGQIEMQVANKQLHFLRYVIKRERIHRAADCIEKEDFRAAERHISIGERIQSQDIEMVVVCYPRLIAAGQNELAERLFNSYETTMLAQIQRWPNDAMALNNLAWMYSQCDRKLEEAFRLSQKSVSLAPNSATYLDTLAEVHYRSGRTDTAIAAMQQCIRMNPRDRHYRENMERFAKGLP